LLFVGLIVGIPIKLIKNKISASTHNEWNFAYETTEYKMSKSTLDFEIPPGKKKDLTLLI
jgi:hypothetical protein